MSHSSAQYRKKVRLEFLPNKINLDHRFERQIVHWLPVIWSPDIRSFRLYGQFLVGPDFPILKIIGYMVKILVIWSKWSDILIKSKAKAIESGVI